MSQGENKKYEQCASDFDETSCRLILIQSVDDTGLEKMMMMEMMMEMMDN